LTTLPPFCAVVMKSGNLNFLEPSGPFQACNGTNLPLPVVTYEGWNFNSGNYLFTTDTKYTCFEVLLSFNVVTSIVYNPLPAMWKSKDTFSSACCVDCSNGAVYRLKNLWDSSEAKSQGLKPL